MKPFVLPTFEAAGPQPVLAGTGWAAVARALRECAPGGSARLDPLLQAVVECAVQAVDGAAYAWIEARSGESLSLRAASRGSAGRELPVADALSRRCLAERRAILGSELQGDERPAGPDATVAAPIAHRGGIAALLKIAGDGVAFGPAEADLACLIAAPVAAALAADADAGAQPDFAAGFHQAAVGMAHLSAAGRLLLVNERLCDIAGRGREAMIGAAIEDIVHPDDVAAAHGLVDALFAGALGSFDTEQRLVRRDGRETWVAIKASLVRDPAAGADFAILVVEDVDARKQAELAAAHDPLTGLLNPRGLQERLDRELDRGANDGRPLTLAVIGVDGLPKVNEILGAAEGDRCLRRVADALRQTCRPGDAVGRVAGDTFVLALPGLDSAAATDFLDRVRAAIARLARDAGWPIDCRIGTASRPRDGATAASLIAAAAARLDGAG